MKNLMGKRRDPSEPYLTVSFNGGGWAKVLKANKADLTSEYATWLVQQDIGIGIGPGIGDSYVAETLRGRPEVTQYDPAVLDQLHPVLDHFGVVH